MELTSWKKFYKLDEKSVFVRKLYIQILFYGITKLSEQLLYTISLFLKNFIHAM